MRTARRTSLALFVAAVALLTSVAPVAAGSATVVLHGDRTYKVVALTFDDGWSPDRTARIVDVLDRHGVAATFFPYADAVKLDPALWRRIARRYPIANHTKTHPNLTRLSSAQIFEEIDRARRIVERVTGRRMTRLFRPPYGAWDSRVARQAYSAGFRKLVLWDVDSLDTRRTLSAAQVLDNATSGRRGSIVLMHAGPAVTPTILADVIRRYKARGFRFVTVCEMLRVPCW